MGENINFVDITKGFRRLGNFPTFSDEIFSTYAEAQAYATAGATGRSNAFCGQMIRILPDISNVDDEPAAYIIDNNYKLVSITENITTDTKLSFEFSYNSLSGSSAVSITVPAGFVLQQVTVKFIDGFINDNALILTSRKTNLVNDEDPQLQYIFVSGTDPSLTSAFHTSNVIITDEDNSEFTLQTMMTFSAKTTFVLYLNQAFDEMQRGHGILKLN